MSGVRHLKTLVNEMQGSQRAAYSEFVTAMVDDQGLLKKELSEDGLHPNSAGYAVMVPQAEKAIQSSLIVKASKQ